MMLNKKQSIVVETNKSIIVKATPGTGKTRVLIAKVIHLIERGISLITLITFTKAAANEISERLVKNFGALPPGVVVGTFHSVISKHINKHIKVGMMSNEDQVSLLHQQYNRYFGEHEGFGEFSTYFEKKASGSLTQTNEEYEQIITNYYEAMKEVTAGMKDLISLGQRLIQEGKIPLLPTLWLLVDEFQDTDLEQIKFILSHGLSDVDLLLVGDPDQSVYAFRDALGPEAFNVVTANFPIVEASLSVNYRSRAEVLSAAQQLIEHNKDNEHLTMVSDQGGGGSVECIQVLNPTQEGLLVAKMIKSRGSKDVAIIARSNFRLAAIEGILREQGIKFSRRSTSSQFKVAELLYLSLLGSLAKRNTGNLISVIEPIVKSYSNAAQISQQLFTSNNMAINPYCDELLRELSHINHLIAIGKLPKSIDSAFAFVVKHFQKLELDGLYKVEYLAEKLSSMKGDLKQRLFKLEMNTEKETCYVQTMTGHSSKGLEFDTVYLIGFSEGIFPPKSTKSYVTDIEEERRIAYVEFTRAINKLTITSPERTDKGKVYGGVSRFIYESGIEVTKSMFAEDYVMPNIEPHYGEICYE